MAAAKTPNALEQAQALLAKNRGYALGYLQQAGADATLDLLKDAANDLQERLQATITQGAGRDSFTAAQLTATLKQVQIVIRQLQQGLKGTLLEHGGNAAVYGAKSTAQFLTDVDKHFKGVGQQPLALPVAQMLERSKNSAQASILARIAADPLHKGNPGVLTRYGMNVINFFEKELRKGVVAKKSRAEMVQAITKQSPFLQAAPRYWAERIVRTEIHGALNRGQWEAVRKADEELGDMVKILAAVFDDRTGWDSYQVHGQIRRPDEPFQWADGLYMHPPNRPNDRETVVPHRISWPIPASLAWKEDSEVVARWKAEGRKGAPPARDWEMTTVPLEKFGAAESESSSSNEDHGEPEVPERKSKEPVADPDSAKFHDPGIPEIPERAPKEPQAAAEEAPFESPSSESPEPEPLTAQDILEHKDAGAKGSNDGGFYTGSDGVQRYVKFYGDSSQALCEHLTNQIYNDLDLGAPDSLTFEHDGRTAYASNVVKGLRTVKDAGLTEDTAKQVLNGFAADVLTGNWDAVGTGLDNVGVVGTGKKQKVLRIDNGGSLLFRAKAGRKPDSVLGRIDEWGKFFDSNVNPYYSQVADKAGVSNAYDLGKGLASQIDKIEKLRKKHGGWAAYVELHAPGMKPADKQQVIDMLEARTKLLRDKAKELKAAAKASKNQPKPWGPIETRAGERIEPREPDKANLAIKDPSKLPRRPLPKSGEHERPPGGESEREYLRKAQEATETLPYPVRAAIESFTGSGYRELRRAEANPADTSLQHRAGQVAELRKSFDLLPKQPGQVFRGFPAPHSLFMGDTADLTLGATASASRKSEVSITFMGGRRTSEEAIFAVVHQRHAVCVEPISTHRSEGELYLRGGSQYRVLSRHLSTENPKIMILEVEEI